MTTNKNKKTKPKTDPVESFEVLLGGIVLVLCLFIPELLVGMILFAILGPGVARLTYWKTVDSMGTRGRDYDNPTNRRAR